MSAGTASTFDLASCEVTLMRACDEVGIRPGVVSPIRLGENAIFHLPREGAVVRIARDVGRLPDAEKELRVARWLSDEGMRTARPLDVPQQVVADGRPTTFWRYVVHEPEASTLAELGAALRTLHHLTPPDSVRLPRHNIFGLVSSRIESAHLIPQADLAFMRARYEQLMGEYAQLKFPLQPCATHGDAHVGNLLREADGGIVMIDLERFAVGHPEADLSTPAIEYQIGWFSTAEYQGFVDSYGFSVMDWSGFSTLQAIGELKMTTWLMQNAGHSREIDREIEHRIKSLRDPSQLISATRRRRIGRSGRLRAAAT